MSGELFFEVPDDNETMAKIVEAIPDEFWWLQGFLYATPQQLAAGNIEMESRMVVSSDDIVVKGHDPWSVVTGEKGPGSVEFRDVGHLRLNGCPVIGKRVAAAFLEKGYRRGQLEFFRHFEDDDLFDRVAGCKIFFKERKSQALLAGENEAGMQPAGVKLSWDKHSRGGREDYVAEILSACRELRLKEYIPTAAAS